jgi:integrase
MSADNSTAHERPSKPFPDFPLFGHATRRWAKKIKGKMVYFGPWSDPAGALHRYQDFLAGKPTQKSADTRAADTSATPDTAGTSTAKKEESGTTGKPSKPYPDFPLFAHATGRWAKKIRGQLQYFGAWSDPEGALAKYLEQKEDLHAGRTPRPDPGEVLVKDVANAFRAAKDKQLEARELSPRTHADYGAIMDMMVTGLGKLRPVKALGPADFADLKSELAKRNGPHRISTIIQVIRSAFKHADDSDLIDRPVRFGPAFKRTSKKTLRLHRAKKGAKLFTPDEVRKLLGAAGVQVKAMLLLGINCGFGNSDCGNLPLSAVDLDRGIIDFPRPKTGIQRRCHLWPETVQALKDVMAKRPEPKLEEHASLVFITKYGQSWAKDENSGPLVYEVRKLLKALAINGRQGLGFYTLRHTFRTVADEAKDQPAADYIMGHEVPHMSSVYRETISDERLRAVSDRVRSWLFDQNDRDQG